MIKDSAKNVRWINPFKKFGMIRVNNSTNKLLCYLCSIALSSVYMYFKRLPLFPYLCICMLLYNFSNSLFSERMKETLHVTDSYSKSAGQCSLHDNIVQELLFIFCDNRMLFFVNIIIFFLFYRCPAGIGRD